MGSVSQLLYMLFVYMSIVEISNQAAIYIFVYDMMIIYKSLTDVL